ncbi:O-acetyl-ADP-ribose deacetylase [bacterium]|nr:O-acetyl-ADP-ribose deacetylase [bacterium]
MKIELLKGDITRMEVDVVVNAANTSLLGGGGVDGAIHRAGGPEILADCMKIRNKQGGCPTGQVVLTTAGRLPAKKVIHTVGPVWNGGTGGERELLRKCYTNSLTLCDELQYKTLAFPNISTGVYRFPKYAAAAIAIEAVQAFHAQHIEKVLFICFDDENYRIYRELLGASGT